MISGSALCALCRHRHNAHACQHEHGTPSKPPHHNREFRDRCEAFGIPTGEAGHDLGVRHGSPFEEYRRRHGVAFPPAPGTAEPPSGGTTPLPLLPVPPVQPSGSKLKRWTCPCGVNARVAIADFDATCNRCSGKFVKVG